MSKARVAAFTFKEIPQSQAEWLAHRLIRRDRELDDRRSCAECAHYVSQECLQLREPIGGGGIQVLHRCVDFKLSSFDPVLSTARKGKECSHE